LSVLDPILEHPQYMSFLSVNDQVSHPYIVVLYF
jgi:hypothetical protein